MYHAFCVYSRLYTHKIAHYYDHIQIYTNQISYTHLVTLSNKDKQKHQLLSYARSGEVPTDIDGDEGTWQT